jgi:hypothetical protein
MGIVRRGRSGSSTVGALSEECCSKRIRRSDLVSQKRSGGRFVQLVLLGVGAGLVVVGVSCVKLPQESLSLKPRRTLVLLLPLGDL